MRETQGPSRLLTRSAHSCAKSGARMRTRKRGLAHAFRDDAVIEWGNETDPLLPSGNISVALLHVERRRPPAFFCTSRTVLTKAILSTLRHRLPAKAGFQQLLPLTRVKINTANWP